MKQGKWSDAILANLERDAQNRKKYGWGKRGEGSDPVRDLHATIEQAKEEALPLTQSMVTRTPRQARKLAKTNSVRVAKLDEKPNAQLTKRQRHNRSKKQRMALVARDRAAKQYARVATIELQDQNARLVARITELERKLSRKT